MNKRLFLIAIFVLSILKVNAQKDNVTLVVSGTGATKEEATLKALRSAIEQAYGTFVSANTQILNDELVKDEIVTISNGNIKQYEELSHSMLPNGNQMITLNATVCISKLVSYVQSKGASTEFAGATFAMNLKLQELHEKNMKIALENVVIQFEKLVNDIPNLFDLDLSLDDPELCTENLVRVHGKITLRHNPNTILVRQFLVNSLLPILYKEHKIIAVPFSWVYRIKKYEKDWVGNPVEDYDPHYWDEISHRYYNIKYGLEYENHDYSLDAALYKIIFNYLKGVELGLKANTGELFKIKLFNIIDKDKLKYYPFSSSPYNFHYDVYSALDYFHNNTTICLKDLDSGPIESWKEQKYNNGIILDLYVLTAEKLKNVLYKILYSYTSVEEIPNKGVQFKTLETEPGKEIEDLEFRLYIPRDIISNYSNFEAVNLNE